MSNLSNGIFVTTSSIDDLRLSELAAWTKTQLATPDVAIEVASADASFRRYFRARVGDRSWIVMDAPPDKEDLGPYINIAELLVAAGIHAPRVMATDLRRGYLLLSDLGSRTYLSALAVAEAVDRLYDDALAALLRMQSVCTAPAQISQLPQYDAALLEREAELFPEWFLRRHLNIDIDANLRRLLDGAFEVLIESALAQPRVFVHRDYHSRNLMVVEPQAGTNPGVLDFQDAVLGPITYDLVSLLRDCYVDWPVARVHAWALGYRSKARHQQLPAGDSDAQWLQWFDLMGAQRHLKAIGIFARLWHRDGKPGYLGDIPRTLAYLRHVLRGYPAFAELSEWVEVHVVPALESRRSA